MEAQLYQVYQELRSKGLMEAQLYQVYQEKD